MLSEQQLRTKIFIWPESDHCLALMNLPSQKLLTLLLMPKMMSQRARWPKYSWRILYRSLGKNKTKNLCFWGSNFSKVTLVLKMAFRLVFFGLRGKLDYVQMKIFFFQAPIPYFGKRTQLSSPSCLW